MNKLILITMVIVGTTLSCGRGVHTQQPFLVPSGEPEGYSIRQDAIRGDVRLLGTYKLATEMGLSTFDFDDLGKLRVHFVSHISNDVFTFVRDVATYQNMYLSTYPYENSIPAYGEFIDAVYMFDGEDIIINALDQYGRQQEYRLVGSVSRGTEW